MGELMSVALVRSCKGSNQDGSKYFLMLTISMKWDAKHPKTWVFSTG